MKHNKVCISKSVGWNPRELQVPKLERVEHEIRLAIKGDFASACKILEWYRFCKSPVNEFEREAINRLKSAMSAVFE